MLLTCFRHSLACIMAAFEAFMLRDIGTILADHCAIKLFQTMLHNLPRKYGKQLISAVSFHINVLLATDDGRDLLNSMCNMCLSNAERIKLRTHLLRYRKFLLFHPSCGAIVISGVHMETDYLDKFAWVKSFLSVENMTTLMKLDDSSHCWGLLKTLLQGRDDRLWDLTAEHICETMPECMIFCSRPSVPTTRCQRWKK